MNIEELKSIDVAARLAKPKLFALVDSDPPATDEVLRDLERSIGVELPFSYRMFLKTYGGGNFGLTTIFSANPGSEWYLGVKLAEGREYLPADVLPFSDDFAGGMYVFRMENGKVLEHVFYWNQDGGLTRTEFADLFEFVAKHAYGNT